MTTAQLPPAPIFRAFDNNGNPLAGGLLYTYAAGTTTPQASYPSSSESTPNTNPVVLNFRGECALWLDPTLNYKLLLTDTLGNTIPGYPVDNIQGPYGYISSVVNQTLVGGALWPQTAGESSAGVTPTYYYYQPGDIRRYGGNADSGTTNNTVPLQSALNANAGYYPVLIEATGTGYYGGIAGPITVPADTDLQLKAGAELNFYSTTASSGPTIGGSATRPGFVIQGGNVKISGQGSIVGPTAAATYVATEIGIIAVGTSGTVPYTNIEINGVTITGWGQYGILTKWIENLRVMYNTIYNCGYSGFTPMSCVNILCIGNEIGPISPGASSNAYGINFTYDTTTSNSRTATNAMCIGIECAYNFVHDIPIWTGITTHGTFDGRFHHNRVYNCWTSIQVSADGSGNYCGENNDVSFNVCDINQYNGSATTVVVANPIGITLNGNATLHAGVTCIGNVLDGYGGAGSATSFGIQASYMQDVVISGNIFRGWSGYGIYMAGTTSIGGVVANNTFDAVGTSFGQDACIYLDGNGTGPVVYGNIHNISTGTTAHYGLAIAGGSVGASVIGPNDFSAAQTAPYYDISNGGVPTASEFAASDFPGTLTVKGGLGINGNAAAAPSTGWGTPVGGSVINNYNITDGGGANSNTNKALAEVIAVLKATGIIGT